MTRIRRRDGADPRANPAASHLVRTLRPLITFSSCVLVIGCLYWGQAILIPIALAILITFLLGPVVSALRRIGLPQTPAVLLVVILTLSVAGGIAWILTHQVTTLAHDLPGYRANIGRKIADIRAAQRGSLAKVRDSATDAMKEPRAADAVGDGATRSMSGVRILGVPAVDEADELALRMLQRLLAASHCELEIVGPTPSSDVVARVGEGRPALVCMLPPGGAAQARHLSKRLRAGFPDIKILVGRWGLKGSADDAHELLSAGADRVGFSLRETALQVSEHLPILAATRDTESVSDLFPPRTKSSFTPSLPT